MSVRQADTKAVYGVVSTTVVMIKKAVRIVMKR